MPSYTPPLRDMHFVLHELLHVCDEFKQLPAHQDLDQDTIAAVLEEGGKFASEVLFPLNQIGDQQGCTLNHETHSVKTPDGFKEAFAEFAKGGWTALSCDPEYGGQGLPIVLNQCFYEMLNSANQAWTMYPGLTHGAYEALHAHGTEAQKKTILPKLTNGEWTSTMCLTEAHCGTDLGMLRTKAVPQPDGTYRLSGAKYLSALATTTLSTTSSIWSWRVYQTRRLVAKALACSSSRNSNSEKTAVWANAMAFIAVA